MNITAVDESGSMKITAFTSESENIIGLKADEIGALKNSVRSYSFTAFVFMNGYIFYP